jgi:hypothetical protein
MHDALDQAGEFVVGDALLRQICPTIVDAAHAADDVTQAALGMIGWHDVHPVTPQASSRRSLRYVKSAVGLEPVGDTKTYSLVPTGMTDNAIFESGLTKGRPTLLRSGPASAGSNQVSPCSSWRGSPKLPNAGPPSAAGP